MDLLLLFDGNISHYVNIIKILTKQKIKTKNTIAKVVDNVLVVKMFQKIIKKFV